MRVMRGPLAHSHFRIERLLAQISAKVPQVNTLRADFIHILDLDCALTETEEAMVNSLLSYRTYAEEIKLDLFQGLKIIVAPKVSQLSVWSQKATHLFHACALTKIKRVERGIVYYINASEKMTWGDKQAIIHLLCDPTKEAVFETVESLQTLFETDTLTLTCPTLDLAQDHLLQIEIENGAHPSVVLNGWHLPDTETPRDLQALLEWSMKVARFNNHVGHPLIGGYLRTYPESTQDQPASLLSLSQKPLKEAIFRLLRSPAIGDKSYLLNISDRTITGLIAQDPMVGPWQIPVADCTIILDDFESYHGKAIALGERSSIAVVDPVIAARLSIGEAITNIAASDISRFSDIALVLDYAAPKVVDITLEMAALAEVLTLAITCRKKILTDESMPSTFSVTASAKVNDVRRTITPLLVRDYNETALIYIDLSNGYQRLGQSILAKVYQQTGDVVPDLNDPILLKAFFQVLQRLRLEGKILAYHDRSDGGLLVTLCEMAFASHVGVQVDISELGRNIRSILFNEELGAVIQVRSEDVESVLAEFLDSEVKNAYLIGVLDKGDRISVVFNEEVVLVEDRTSLQEAWSETSYSLQAMRDNPRCAKKQFDLIGDQDDPGLKDIFSFDLNENIVLPYIQRPKKPTLAILREEGCHGYQEIAAAFQRANFECVQVKMSDLLHQKITLEAFNGMAVCGGFSFGDVLGAGQGWAKKILFNPGLKDQFAAFFNRENTFTVGFSNGCQMLTGLRTIIPGAELWPTFTQNYSEQFESRWCLVEVQKSVSPFLKGMEGSQLLVPVAHFEGRVEFESEEIQEEALKQGLIALRYVDSRGRKTKLYPANPSGSPLGITGISSRDGRVLIMMPHPERAFLAAQHPRRTAEWKEDGPWLRLFREIRVWVN